MAKLPLIVSIKREDYKDSPSWFERFLSPLNLFLRTVYEAFDRNLTFTDNISSVQKEFTILAGSTPADNTAAFTYKMKTDPIGVIPLRVIQESENYVPIQAAIGISWRKGNGEIIIDAISGLTDGEVYSVRVLVI
jgi:hypothetical protein